MSKLNLKTPKETADQIIELLEREGLKSAIIPRELFMQLASRPGATRTRLRTSFRNDVLDWLDGEDWHTALMRDGDLYIANRSYIVHTTEILTPSQRRMTRNQRKRLVNDDGSFRLR